MDSGVNHDCLFIEDCSSSEDEEGFDLQKQPVSCSGVSQVNREGSPPLLLAFSNTCRRTLQDRTSEEEEEEEDEEDQSIEEWMILENEEQLGDSSIQLNLSYWNSSEEDSGDQKDDTFSDTWAVSNKDKYGADQSFPNRYFTPGRSLICNICSREGHLAKRCYYNKPKRPTCVLCGTQGHIQRNCPNRPCSTCGLPSHGLKPCERPPMWNQHCQRCGISGHLSDACPDTWRQYHLTVRLEVPPRPHTVQTRKHRKHAAYCYNCSYRGHYGYECTKRRMISGTSPSLPFVCIYDTRKDMHQHCTRMQKTVKECVNAGFLLEQQSEPTGMSDEEHQTVQTRSRTKQQTCRQLGRRKTWPERRKERREVKRLRREAHTRREVGLLWRSRGDFDDEVRVADPFRAPLQSQRQSLPTPDRKRKAHDVGRRSKKSREAERWMKRGGRKRGNLYPHEAIDICRENLLSPKQRVRHRRR
ncbi:uncharacterized protein V6R79_000173 [Siganus canaliculatus]